MSKSQQFNEKEKTAFTDTEAKKGSQAGSRPNRTAGRQRERKPQTLKLVQ